MKTIFYLVAGFIPVYLALQYSSNNAENPTKENSNMPPGKASSIVKSSEMEDNTFIDPKSEPFQRFISSAAEKEIPNRGILYKWRDESGSIHISTYPPEESWRTQPFSYSYHSVGALELDGSKLTAPKEHESRQPGTLESNLMTVYTPEGIIELMKLTNRVETLLEERKETFNKLKEEL
ncbi:MAG: hypothetical protein GY731_14330 [Gammaproteobacteria bacterium]|nr:hypothetical protein [Gammaproteobacteria bacterium]